jgi:hypothetical protein
MIDTTTGHVIEGGPVDPRLLELLAAAAARPRWGASDSASPPSSENILQEASKDVYGPRQAAYGHPRENFERTARLWNGYLFAKGSTDLLLAPEDVAHMMVLLKMARLIQTPDHRDSWVDIAGYAAAGARSVGVDE